MKYPIGTKYLPIGRYSVRTVTDYLTTTNLAGEIVSQRYVATHEFIGQALTESDVLETTIARGIANLKSL